MAGSQLVLRLSVQAQQVTLQAPAGQLPAQAFQPCLNAFHLCFSFAWDLFPTHPNLTNSHSEEEERYENYFSK